MQAPDTRSRWQERLHRSGFFFGALLLHLVVFLMVATYVVIRPPPAPPETPTVYIVHDPEPVAPPPHSPAQPTIDPAAGLSGPEAPIPVIGPGAADLHQALNGIEATGSHNVAPSAPPAIPKTTGLSPERIELIRKNVLRIRTPDEIKRHDPTCTFPIYVATYAGGDWAYNSRLDKDGNIVAGSIPDLAAKINEWSHGAIKGVIVPKPLAIGGPELVDKMPPFIFFTGHKDFVLTKVEIANLRDYLQGGGAIWGDNALAGKGSRFDIAFHREMKLVVPDHDFESMPMDGDIFTKGRFAIDKIPAGINYHAEPIEHLDIDGVLAILYTPNDYCDLYAMRILPGDMKIQLGRPDPKAPPLTTPYLIQSHRSVFFRNFTLESSLAVHHLGMNIVTFFITRFDEKLQLGP